MAGMEMDKLFTLFGKSIYFAGKGFLNRGLYVYAFKRNIRLIAFNNFTKWTGID